MNASTLIQAVRQAGVVGEGGAGFPAHVKYDTQAGTLIANGCEVRTAAAYGSASRPELPFFRDH